MDELWNQTKDIFVPGTEVAAEEFPKQIAFNVIPHIDVFMDDGFTERRVEDVAETNKMLDPAIKLTATCVRVPVFVGHSEAVNIEFEDPLDEDEARDILREAPGVIVIDKREASGYVTPEEASATSRSSSAASATTRPSRTACRSGWSPTTCARARRSTRCRSPSCSAAGC